MSINISGLSASVLTQALSSTQSEYVKLVESLASGFNADIEIADEYISQKLNIDSQSRYSAIANAQQGLNFTDLADAALGSITEDIGAIRELAVKASNGTYSADQKQAIQAQINQLSENIQRTISGANYSGINVLNVTTGNAAVDKLAEMVKFQVGTGTSSLSEISYDPNIELPEIKFDITTTEGAQNAIKLSDEMLNSINTKRADIAGVQTSLLSSIEQNTVAIKNNQSSSSQISDTDYAKTMIDLIKNQYSQEALIKVLKTNFESQMNVLDLISGVA